MIAPPSGLSGTSSNPITIRALNDGQVLIDGQFARVPLHLVENQWIHVGGIDARNGTAYVARFYRSSHIVVRRSVFWDADMARGSVVVLVHASPNTLLEDVAAFGTGTRQFDFHGGDPTTCRRCWGRWEGEIDGGGSSTYHLNYNGTRGLTCENCLGTWSAESMPETYNLLGTSTIVTNFEVRDAATIFRVRGGPNPGGIDARLLGSIAYIPARARLLSATGAYIGPMNGLIRAPGAHGFNFDNVQIRHFVGIVSPSHPAFNIVPRLHLLASTIPVTGWVYSNGTIVGGTGHPPNVGGNIIAKEWVDDVGDSRRSGTSLSAVPSPWTSTGNNGANLCFRWVNRQATNEPLWPWPMNDRIHAATAMAGAYSGPCPECLGGRARRTATDVTADIEALLGPIPSHCRG